MGQRRIADVATAVHHTATTNDTWDGSAAEAGMPNDKKALTYCHAWHEEGATDVNGQYKFPHHEKDGGPAFLAACRNGLARLDQADIPDADREGVRSHLRAHLDDATGDHAGHSAGPGTYAAVARLMNRMSSGLPKVVRRARAMAAEAGEAYVRESPFWTFNKVSSDTTELMIYSDIGFSWFDDEGITAASFAKDLAAVRTPNLRLRINSPGGDVFDGIAIANLIREWGGNVTGLVDGLCASIATVILMACDEIEMGRNTQAMIHDASGFCFGNPADMDEMSALLNMISDNIAGVYADRAGGAVKTWRERMTAETWFTADDMVSAGLADRVTPLASEDPGMMPCPECNGTGKTGGKTCGECGGSGQVPAEDAEDADGAQCKTCDGTGKIRRGKVKCPDCNGTGKTGADGQADALASAVRRAYAAHATLVPRRRPAATADPEPEPRRRTTPDGLVIDLDGHAHEAGDSSTALDQTEIPNILDAIRSGTTDEPVDVDAWRDLFAGFRTNMPETPVRPAAPVDLGPAPERPAEPVRNVLADAVAHGVRTGEVNQPAPDAGPAPSGPVDLGEPPARPAQPEPSSSPRSGLADLIRGAADLAAKDQPEPEPPKESAEPVQDNDDPPFRLDLKDFRRALTESRY